MKKILGLGTLALAGVLAFTGCSCGKEKLPEARLEKTKDGTTCMSNSYGNECSGVNANEAKNLYKYLNRSDVLYIDLRDFKDYEFQHLQGFENLQFYADIWDKDGTGATQLFNKDYTPRYADSVAILESYVPKDKTIFLMCAGGGRVVDMMKIMEYNGWDMSKVYNVGGMGGVNNDLDNYKSNVISKSKTALTFKSATTTEVWDEHTYTTTVHVALDKDGKITHAYITGDKEYSANAAEGWGPEKWIAGREELVKGVIGKTKTEVEAMVGTGEAPAAGADVVSGASVTSNRVYKAIVAALNK